jgi:Protein of unknown function (DUF1553)/Protein of unknown function (DUF1549)/Planctomycete cytochrome C/Concanavalin A-like lectin/glucanases superfamily
MNRHGISVVLSFWLTALVSFGRAAPIDFNRDVKPIISDQCFHCHGPDPEARQAELRLDTRAGIFRQRDKVTVTVPGQPEASELVRRIDSDNPDDKMPPPDSHRQLTAAQRDVLRRWVKEGAEWEQHWSFAPLQKEPMPDVGNASWVRNEIDRFVLKSLNAAHQTPKPEADRARLIRRVTLDLTGLPPTLAEIDAFLADAAPDAYEKVVDRLLASPRYGERVASEWLDLARFADTHGYQADRSRAMWPYRDWVIKAFNENLPFDQFITWQLAGDLLPNATKEQQLATAFNRLHMQNEEGGIVEEEFRVAYVVDRVDTFGTAFLGLTLECSRCHDHKFDPITQRDFYSLFAFFQNIDEAGQTSYFTDSMPVPALLLSTAEQDAEIAAQSKTINERLDSIAALKREATERFEKWLAERPAKPPALRPIAEFSFEDLSQKQIVNLVDASKPGKIDDDPQPIPSPHGQGAKLDGENGFTFPKLGNFRRGDPFSLALWLKMPAKSPRAVVLHHSKAPVDAGSRGYEIVLEDGHVAFGMHHMWPENSLKVRSQKPLQVDEWQHLTITYDGSSRATGVHIYLDGLSVDCEVIRDGLHKDIDYGKDEPDLAVGHRFRDNGFKDGCVDELQVFDRELTTLEAAGLADRGDLTKLLNTPASALSPHDRERLFEYYLASNDHDYCVAISELSAARNKQNALTNAIPEAMVMRELPSPKPAFILTRGAYDARGETVTADVPRALPPLPASAPRNRLTLAQWLTSPEQPLTSRVIVNRAWQMMFGRGIVETSENFGAQGSPPTHPELLDWLAQDFMGSGWNYKSLLRKIALSATYRQSSMAPASELAADPDNRQLARGPARRLTAEMLRDQALADSGLLVEKLGGPSVKPYQPDGLWDVASVEKVYRQSHGDDLYRRSLYTFWKRTIPPPAMMTLDAADRSYCTARRQSTSTPLQALALLNDVQRIEAARHIAERMLRIESNDASDRLKFGFRLVTGRLASERELKVLLEMYHEQREEFSANFAGAEAILKTGESKRDDSLDATDLATYTVVAIALLNHDEALMRR